jgi:hypothetical protein
MFVMDRLASLLLGLRVEPALSPLAEVTLVLAALISTLLGLEF